MHIHWFPGHMTKAMRLMASEMANINSIIYVLDARAVSSCENVAFEDIIKNKPRLYVINKADMVPASEVAKWKKAIENKGFKCITTNSTVKGGSGIFISALREINSETIEKWKAKGVKKTIRAMVIGVPNCGKSTLINSLIAKKKTVTGDRPGVTRGKQWISIDPYIDLLDTPGTLYPDFSDQTKARNLAIIGSISDAVVDQVELSKEIIEFLTKNYPESLRNRYYMTDFSDDIFTNLEVVGRRRGFVVKGGEIDLDRTANAVIQDFRKEAFGKIILERYLGE